MKKKKAESGWVKAPNFENAKQMRREREIGDKRQSK